MKYINNKNKGFFIFEALVAVFIFSVGILGLLRHQTDSLQATSSAQYRTQATYMAKNLISKVTLDKNNLSSYVDGSSTAYTDWRNELITMLPGVEDKPPELTLTTVNGTSVLSITIFWKEPSQPVHSKFDIQTAIL